MHVITDRQRQVLRVVTTRHPIGRGEIARNLGCSVPTAAQHPMALRRKGLIESTGVGQHSKWVPARRLGEQPREIKQAASVWEYAMRCAA